MIARFPAPAQPTPISPMPLGVAVLTAAAAGLLLDDAFPDLGIWIAAFPAIALALVAHRGRRPGGGFLVGFVFGAAFFFPQIDWATTFLGPVPWSALSILMALWCGLGGMLIAVAYRVVPRAWPGLGGRMLLIPAIVAGLWTAREAISAVWPYGGFSWGRVAFSQSDSPFSHLFAWLGVSGVSFVMVLLAAGAVEIVLELVRARRRPLLRIRPLLVPRLGALAAVLIALLAVPSWTALAPPNAGTLTVGAVQGDTKAGYFDPPSYVGQNLVDQYRATAPLLAPGAPSVDVVLWPEGSTDVNPRLNPQAASVFDMVTKTTGAPLVAGIIDTRATGQVDASGQPIDQYFNTAALWHTGQGVVAYYDKRHPVPFGEYVPDRAFWRMFAPSLIDLIGREFTPGTTGSVLDVGSAKTGGRSVLTGVAICFDIVDDQLLTDMVNQGAQFISAPTNNADFGLTTDESVQQLAIARIRALETSRSVVQVSTVGASAVIAPDGTIQQELSRYQPGVMVQTIALSTTVTPAVAVGRQLEWLVCFGALALLLAAMLTTRTKKRVEEARSAVSKPGR